MLYPLFFIASITNLSRPSVVALISSTGLDGTNWNFNVSMSFEPVSAGCLRPLSFVEAVVFEAVELPPVQPANKASVKTEANAFLMFIVFLPYRTY